jgi:phenylacetate-CoA ligase
MRTRDSMLQYQLRTLQGLLQYVWKHSSFYQDYYASYGIREKDLPDLTISDLPFLSKQTLMAHFDKVVTDPRLCKQELEQWIQDVRDPRQLYHDDFIVMHSSGSSGDVAIFVYDRRVWPILGTTVAKHLPPPEEGRSGQTRVAAYLASHGHFGGVTSNVLLPKSIYSVLILSLLDTTEHVVEQLNAFQPHRLVGYSSSVARLAELALQGVLSIQPQSIIVSGDLLTPSMKRRMQQAWQAPIYEIYASSESIYLAIKAPGQEEMVVIDDLNILEVLDQAHQPVLPGAVGRAVLTNLYNRYLPILRYELGDYVARGHRSFAAAYTTIQNIQGRVNDALPVVLHDGTLDTIHPIILSEFYVAGLEIVQFISRRPDHVQVRYVARQNIDGRVRQEFQRLLDMKGAQRTAFEVHQVDQIDKDPQTGKLRLVRVAPTTV